MYKIHQENISHSNLHGLRASNGIYWNNRYQIGIPGDVGSNLTWSRIFFNFFVQERNNSKYLFTYIRREPCKPRWLRKYRIHLCHSRFLCSTPTVLLWVCCGFHFGNCCFFGGCDIFFRFVRLLSYMAENKHNQLYIAK